MAYLVTPFRYGLSQTHKVYLLEGVSAECADGHLSGNNDDGGRVEHGISHARQCVSGTGTAGDE